MRRQKVLSEAIDMAVEGIELAVFLIEDQKREFFFNNTVRFFGSMKER